MLIRKIQNLVLYLFIFLTVASIGLACGLGEYIGSPDSNLETEKGTIVVDSR